ncbi:MAG: hypothetical protein ABW321_02120 [Polyangiales bacterium]
MSELRGLVENYVKRAQEQAEHIAGDAEATKHALVCPLFAILGYDLTDPRDCIPGYRPAGGDTRVAWAFSSGGSPVFFVALTSPSHAASDADRVLLEQLGRETHVKLAILTDGLHWRFYTVAAEGLGFDREPFLVWSVLSDASPPYELLALLAKATFVPALITGYARRVREQQRLLTEITRLLRPASEFTRLAIAQLEPRELTREVLESWTPLVARALSDWVRQQLMAAALHSRPPSNDNRAPAPRQTPVPEQVLPDEPRALALVQRVLGHERPIGAEPTASCFLLHLSEQRSRVFARLQLKRRLPVLWVPLPIEQAVELVGGRSLTPVSGWSTVTLEQIEDLSDLGELLIAAYHFACANDAGVSAA